MPARQKMMTPRFRACFTQTMFEPRAVEEGQTPKYGLVAVFEPDTDISKLEEAIKDVGAAEWGVKGKFISPLRNAGEKAEDYGEPFVDGAMFMSCRSNEQPGLVTGSRNSEGHFDKITEAKDFYGGCYARATITFYATSKGGQNRVAVGLNNVQRLAFGNRLDGRKSADSEFDEIEEEDLRTEEGGSENIEDVL